MKCVKSGLLGAAALVCLMLIDPAASNAQSNGYRKDQDNGWNDWNGNARRSDKRPPSHRPTYADPSIGYYPQLWEAQRRGGCYTDDGYGRVSGCTNR